MPFLQLTLDIGRAEPEPCEDVLFDLGALSVTLEDAADDPVLEPAPGETPLWPTIRIKALFDAATVARLAVVSPAADPQQTASITFTNATGAYDWELRDRTSNVLLSSGSGAWQPGQPIALNGSLLQLDGVPAAGDVFSVAQTLYPAASNGNALAFAALRDEAFVGGETITDAYASVMAGVGVSVQSARTSADVSASVASNARERVSAEAGVNLDEEAARLIQFQQSYQAAAKVLQVAQSLFDTLLQTAGR